MKYHWQQFRSLRPNLKFKKILILYEHEFEKVLILLKKSLKNTEHGLPSRKTLCRRQNCTTQNTLHNMRFKIQRPTRLSVLIKRRRPLCISLMPKYWHCTFDNWNEEVFLWITFKTVLVGWKDSYMAQSLLKYP